MTRKLDHILVIDVEATCWQGEPPAGQGSEIIEIGLCLLEVATLTRVERRSVLARPARSRKQHLVRSAPPSPGGALRRGLL